MNAVTIERADYRVSERTLLSDADLSIERGEFVGIVGPNGAGKSTLLKLIAGDLSPTTGRVLIDGRDTTKTTYQDLATIRSYLGPQTAGNNVFTVHDVVAMGRHPHRRSQLEPKDHDLVVEGAMLRTDVAHLSDRVVSTLSTGERQRVGLARVLAQETHIILLDEPTSALDVGHQESVMRLLRTAVGEGVAVIAVLHDLNLAAAHTDRLVLLDKGRILSTGTPRSVLFDDILSEVYGQRMRVIVHPDRDCPLVLTLDDE